MQGVSDNPLPTVALWRINALRLIFLLMACVMGFFVWQQLLFDWTSWKPMHSVAKAMLGALALLSLLGVRYPLQMLPLMLYEIAWKTVWLLLIALRSWQAGLWTPDIESIFTDCIGIVIAYFIVPWRYVWARYFSMPMEPLRRPR